MADAVKDGKVTAQTFANMVGVTPRDIQNQCKRGFHPAEKPVELLERVVRVSCPENGVILDPFMGSGSTGVAAVKNHRDFIGIELDTKYFEIAKERINEAVNIELFL